DNDTSAKASSVTGPRFSFVRNGLVDQHKLNQADIFRVGTMIQDIIMMEDDHYSIVGVMIIQDMADITMGYALFICVSILPYRSCIKLFRKMCFPKNTEETVEELMTLSLIGKP
ncbi:CRAL TRIO domain containing protein, partial [Asbolus verrucosus]